MSSLRRFLHRHRSIAALLVVAALALKLLVPAGFMPLATRDGTLVVALCTGNGATAMRLAIPGLPDDPAPAKADTPCAFAGLAMPMVGGVDATLLAAAIAFVLAIALAPTAVFPVRAAVRLRPPLRGPPTPA